MKSTELQERPRSTSLENTANHLKKVNDVYFSYLLNPRCTDDARELVHGKYSQEDDSRIAYMQNAMERFLTVFLEPDINARKDANHWCVLTFDAFASHGAVSLNDVDVILTDTIFLNKTAHLACDTFIGVIQDDGHMTFRM